MKNLFKIGILSLLTLAAFSSCSDDDSYSYNYFYAYGNILADEGGIEEGYSIILDNGNELIINNNYVFNANVTDGERVYAQFNIISQSVENNKKEYIVDLYGLNKVLVKDPILQSEIGTPDHPTQAEIGNDPIRPTLILAEGKYLTVEFRFYSRRGSNVRHLINLVWDNNRVPESQDDKTVYLTLRHNGYNDVPVESNFYQFVRTYGNISFDITSILPPGETSVPIKVIWTEYGRTLEDRQEYYVDRTYSYTPNQEPLRSASTISPSGNLFSDTYSLPFIIK